MGYHYKTKIIIIRDFLSLWGNVEIQECADLICIRIHTASYLTCLAFLCQREGCACRFAQTFFHGTDLIIYYIILIYIYIYIILII